MMAGEWSGVSATVPVDLVSACFSGTNSLCQRSAAGTNLGILYSPGYSAEGISFAGTCSSSSTAPAGINITLTTATPNSNPVAWGISSGSGIVGMTPTSGCNQFSGIAFGFVQSGATQNMTANVAYIGSSTQASGTNPSLTANVVQTGDLVKIAAWCITTCGITSVTLGAQTATCPGGNASGLSSANTGQGFVCYVLTNTNGPLTLTFTPSGSPTHAQVSYIDYSISAQTTIAYDKAAIATCDSSCSEGTTVTTPSITPTSTALLTNFIYTQHHAMVPHSTGTQWVCYEYLGSAETGTCNTTVTINIDDWILRASGSTSSNTDILDSNDPFQSIIAAFDYTSTVSSGSIPRRRFGQW